ncbi:hypothetical protein KAR29_03045 [Aminithiophilus ramosus]|uniref:Uncharacterized protein n=1 Tax=Aminithiophilus ramosus TaxID=3029084 RepID=A0A9Q7F081_9BACT|nr:hypothetical protein [Aminithiophilus ramosus]QTX32907.1 hypothetical protein KAR29_03045 [Aminithiophilus ramosus]
MKRVLLLLLVCLSTLLGAPRSSPGAELERRSLWVTSPWLALMCRFVGGVYVDVRSLVDWDEGGRYSVRGKALPEGATVIALDDRDILFYGLKVQETHLSMRTLYSRLSLSELDRERLFLDPAGLPFLGQRLLVVLADIDSDRYSYYQRRLAEFQSRLESTVDVGRQIIGDVSLLDLTGRSSLLIEGAVKAPIRPPDAVWNKWCQGEGLPSLRLSLQEARRREWLVVVDVWTPETVRLEAEGTGPIVVLPSPSLNQDLFLFLYDQYLAIWNARRQKESGKG